MPDPKLEQLLEEWEDLRHEGREVSAEELCQNCPELLNELKQRIVVLKSMDWLLESDSSEEQEGIANAAWKELPRTLGRYRLDELVGTGGFGQVWKGFDPELQRTVAIKVPRPDRLASSDQADKFLAEARKSPNFDTLASFPCMMWGGMANGASLSPITLNAAVCLNELKSSVPIGGNRPV
jgi:hypothetical protein